MDRFLLLEPPNIDSEHIPASTKAKPMYILIDRLINRRNSQQRAPGIARIEHCGRQTVACRQRCHSSPRRPDIPLVLRRTSCVRTARPALRPTGADRPVETISRRQR